MVGSRGPVGTRGRPGRRRVAHVLVGVDVRLADLRHRARRRAAPERAVGGPRAGRHEPARRRAGPNAIDAQRGGRRPTAGSGWSTARSSAASTRSSSTRQRGPRSIPAPRPASCWLAGREASRARSRARTSWSDPAAATRWSCPTTRCSPPITCAQAWPDGGHQYVPATGPDVTSGTWTPIPPPSARSSSRATQLAGGRSWGARLGMRRSWRRGAGPSGPRAPRAGR